MRIQINKQNNDKKIGFTSMRNYNTTFISADKRTVRSSKDATHLNNEKNKALKTIIIIK